MSGNHDLLTVSVVLPFPECRIVGIILDVAFQIDLFHLNMYLSFLHVVCFLFLDLIIFGFSESLFLHTSLL